MKKNTTLARNAKRCAIYFFKPRIRITIYFSNVLLIF